LMPTDLPSDAGLLLAPTVGQCELKVVPQVALLSALWSSLEVVAKFWMKCLTERVALSIGV